MEITLSKKYLNKLGNFFVRNYWEGLIFFLCAGSVGFYLLFLINTLGLSYNDARSHLDIARRVVEGLKPGLAQLGSVWLPLNHVLMLPFVWNDWMWHTGLAGSLQNMIAFVGTGILIAKFLEKMRVGILGQIIGVLVFVLNINVLYLQSTAMTELVLLGTMTAGVYYLYLWTRDEQILNLIKSAFWIMLATLTRYDGWFLLVWAGGLVVIHTLSKNQKKQKFGEILKQVRNDMAKAEGALILFLTLAGFGVALWFLWNQLIFKDALYFAFGPFSAHAQQEQLRTAGVLATKGNILLSLKVYLYALLYNTYTFPAILALIGSIIILKDKLLGFGEKLATSALLAPFVFNVLALFLGFSVLFVQGISGDTWFNVRYGVMLMPTIAIFIGFLVDRARDFRLLIIGLLAFVLFFAFVNFDAVTIDDARVGSSQKNVSEVAGYLADHAKDEKGFILISAASHDAIIFSSGLPMKRFIHEGTSGYWQAATLLPDRWARWIIMRTYDENDLTWKFVSKTKGFAMYNKVASYPFADVYELQPQYLPMLITEPILGKQR
jgi:hypothetical protein